LHFAGGDVLPDSNFFLYLMIYLSDILGQIQGLYKCGLLYLVAMLQDRDL